MPLVNVALLNVLNNCLSTLPSPWRDFNLFLFTDEGIFPTHKGHCPGGGVKRELCLMAATDTVVGKKLQSSVCWSNLLKMERTW